MQHVLGRLLSVILPFCFLFNRKLLMHVLEVAQFGAIYITSFIDLYGFKKSSENLAVEHICKISCINLLFNYIIDISS